VRPWQQASGSSGYLDQRADDGPKRQGTHEPLDVAADDEDDAALAAAGRAPA